MSEKKQETGWYVRPDHPHQVMDVIGNHVADTYGKFGEDAAERAVLIVETVNERPLVEDVVHAAQMIAEYGAKQLHMKNLRAAVLALQKRRTAVSALKEMRSKL